MTKSNSTSKLSTLKPHSMSLQTYLFSEPKSHDEADTPCANSERNSLKSVGTAGESFLAAVVDSAEPVIQGFVYIIAHGKKISLKVTLRSSV
jgi:hypothetical protein